MDQLLTRILYPVLVSGALLVHGVSLAFGLKPLLATYIVSTLSMLVIAYLEWKRPFRLEWTKSFGDFWTDVISTYGVFSVVLQGVKLALVVAAYRVSSFHPISGALSDFGPWLNQVAAPSVQLLFWIPLAELFYYLFHLACHRIPFLWRFHSVHHGAPRVYWANSGRFHPVDLSLSLFLMLLPLYLLGASVDVLAWFLSFNAVTGLLEHANIDYRAGAFNRVLNSGELHRWHHSKDAEISAQNLGKTLSIWDQVFGTYYLPVEKVVGAVGIDGQKTVPVTLWGQMIYPFRSTRS